jgi:protein-tyrosine-phosphatase
MKIQFVCKGNKFRSPLAEAYLKSKDIPGLVISSSGIAADKDLNEPLCDYTILVAGKHNLANYLPETRTVTTRKDLESQDLVVFIDDSIREFCFDKLYCDLVHYETWDIPDIPDELTTKVPRNIQKILPYAEDSFARIIKGVDHLIVSVASFGNDIIPSGQ